MRYVRTYVCTYVQEYTLPGRVVTPEVLEPNRLREAIPAIAVTPVQGPGQLVEGLTGKVRFLLLITLL
jgi:hypothetical protein